MYAFWRTIGVMALAVVMGALAAAARADDGATKSATLATSPAAELVEQALRAEFSGNMLERAMLLRKAIAADPDYAPAHWQHGEIRAKDGWLSIDDSMKQLRRAGDVAQYRRRQATTPFNTGAQRQLGDWCAAAGLDAQARVHWATALALQPNSPALLSKLGLVRNGRDLVPAAQLQQIRHQDNEAKVTAMRWSQALKRIEIEYRSRDAHRVSEAISQLRAIKDVSALPTMETASTNGGPAFANLIVEAIAAMPEQAATDALVREAVSSQYDTVRESAAAALKERSLFSYVPTLISILQAPIRVEFEQYFDEANSRHRLAMFQDGPLAAYQVLSANGSSFDLNLGLHPKRGTFDFKMQAHEDDTLEQDLKLARQAEELNQKSEFWNARAIEALGATTGQQAGDQPADWWKWWLDYNEIYQYPEKPVLVAARNYTPLPSRFRTHYSSCFVAGTKVWTMDGPMPIEQVKPGECVLAQLPATGELAYRPVVTTTVRPESPVRAIKTSRDTILATRGHPFWVSGAGWRMVKELKVGDRLHSMAGPVEIIAAEDAAPAVCYNLVVAEFGNYFVGEEKILVHDNTIRDVTPVLVPGLVAR